MSATDTGEERVPALVTPWVVVTVRGPSMAPALRSGQRLLVRRVRLGRRVSVGDVVLVRFPARPDVLAVKRVVRAVPGGHWVQGDNSFASDDSRAFGVAVVVGRVVVRLWPWPGAVDQPRRWT